MTKQIEVVITPALLPLYQVKGKTVVVIDILRATSSICVAFKTGVNKILPVSTPEECSIFKDFDFICAAERNAVKIDGFDLGNSPFEYLNPLIIEKNLALTTTNGTKALKLSKDLGAEKIVIGSFLNIDVLCNWLKHQPNDVILLCAGWKDKANLEDTLFAGAVANKLLNDFNLNCDTAIMSQQLYLSMQHDLENFVRKSSHAQRFKLLNTAQDDVHFCLQFNTAPTLPIMQGEYIFNTTISTV
ncbi:MAG: 2-phosphosulfolactate phosphatase [Bacteroidia bacterium]|nr:2-phosphosulfolactate phosphatase [Bacteroidia bacterium]MBP9688783.1 2-phosphosulfolactate phosphatase [Bacteroidia bacterium]